MTILQTILYLVISIIFTAQFLINLSKERIWLSAVNALGLISFVKLMSQLF